MSFDLEAIMEAIAARATAAGVTKRAYAFPVKKATIPCMIVGYPDHIDFDLTFARGGDSATFPIYFLVGLVTDQAARHALSLIITGAGAASIKTALDGDLGGVVDTCVVDGATIETVTVGTIPYLSARFDLEVVS